MNWGDNGQRWLSCLFDAGLSMHEIETVLWLHANKLFVLEAKAFIRFRTAYCRKAPETVRQMMQDVMDIMWS
jgi:hypothetical protein